MTSRAAVPVLLVLGAVLLVGGVIAWLVDGAALSGPMATLPESAYTGATAPVLHPDVRETLLHVFLGVAVVGGLLVAAAAGLRISGRAPAA